MTRADFSKIHPHFSQRSLPLEIMDDVGYMTINCTQNTTMS